MQAALHAGILCKSIKTIPVNLRRCSPSEVDGGQSSSQPSSAPTQHETTAERSTGIHDIWEK